MSDSVAVVISWRKGDRDRKKALGYVKSWYKRFLNCEVVLADDIDPDHFNRGRAFNTGFLKTKASTIVFADADFIVSGTSLKEAIKLSQSNSYVVPFSKIHYLSKVSSGKIYDGAHPFTAFSDTRVVPKFLAGGPFVMSASNFNKVEGFDYRFRGWGFEDLAFKAKVTRLLGAPLKMAGTAVHLYHDPTVGPANQFLAENERLCKEIENETGR